MKMTSAARFGVALAIAAAATAASAPPAGAKVWFNDLGKRDVRWDQRVTSTILGCPGNESCRAHVEGRDVYLRRGAVRRTGAKRRNLRLVARIDSQGTIVFRVPHVPAGRYHLVSWSDVGDWHRWLPVSGTFRIDR
jgi:hypothetical protein